MAMWCQLLVVYESLSFIGETGLKKKKYLQFEPLLVCQMIRDVSWSTVKIGYKDIDFSFDCISCLHFLVWIQAQASENYIDYCSLLS